MGTNLVNGLPDKQKEVVNYILKYIKQNKLKGDSVLPSQNSLAQKFGVNRNVVRTAFSHLRSQGYVYSIKGKGFFVAEHSKPLIYKHSSTIGFSEIVGKEFGDYHNELVSCTRKVASPIECLKLSINEGDKVCHLKTVRSIKGEAFAVCYSCIPERLIPRIEDYIDDFKSINDVLVNRYGYDQPSCDSIAIEAVAANIDLIQYFNMPQAVPILSINCVFSTEETGPIEYFIIKARSDLFRFTMDFKDNR